MALKLKARQQLEKQLHSATYKNIQILTLTYPPSKEFQIVFKEDMFMKSNPTAFQQVIYYLLHVLDSYKLKKNISYWPILDRQMELKFRKEITEYINKINQENEINIPNLTPSQLVSPGGFKFIQVMHKLSQFVLRTHLMKNPENKAILLPIHPSTNSAISSDILNKIEILTGDMKTESENMNALILTNFKKSQEQADKLKEKHSQVDKDILNLTEEIKSMKLSTSTVNNLDLDIDEGYIGEIQNELDQCLKVIKQIKLVDRKPEELTDILQLLKNCNNFLCYQVLKAKPINSLLLQELSEEIDNAMDQGLSLNNDLELALVKLKQMLRRLSDFEAQRSSDICL